MTFWGVVMGVLGGIGGVGLGLHVILGGQREYFFLLHLKTLEQL